MVTGELLRVAVTQLRQLVTRELLLRELCTRTTQPRCSLNHTAPISRPTRPHLARRVPLSWGGATCYMRLRSLELLLLVAGWPLVTRACNSLELLLLVAG